MWPVPERETWLCVFSLYTLYMSYAEQHLPMRKSECKNRIGKTSERQRCGSSSDHHSRSHKIQFTSLCWLAESIGQTKESCYANYQCWIASARNKPQPDINSQHSVSHSSRRPIANQTFINLNWSEVSIPPSPSHPFNERKMLPSASDRPFRCVVLRYATPFTTHSRRWEGEWIAWCLINIKLKWIERKRRCRSHSISMCSRQLFHSPIRTFHVLRALRACSRRNRNCFQFHAQWNESTASREWKYGNFKIFQKITAAAAAAPASASGHVMHSKSIFSDFYVGLGARWSNQNK